MNLKVYLERAGIMKPYGGSWLPDPEEDQEVEGILEKVGAIKRKGDDPEDPAYSPDGHIRIIFRQKDLPHVPAKLANQNMPGQKYHITLELRSSEFAKVAKSKPGTKVRVKSTAGNTNVNNYEITSVG